MMVGDGGRGGGGGGGGDGGDGGISGSGRGGRLLFFFVQVFFRGDARGIDAHKTALTFLRDGCGSHNNGLYSWWWECGCGLMPGLMGSHGDEVGVAGVAGCWWQWRRWWNH